MKRFYKLASLDKDEIGSFLTLDQKPMRTPKHNFLYVPSELQNPILEEWNSVEDIINPQQMPVSQIIITAQDLYNEKKIEWYQEILSYLETDLLLYWSHDPPEIFAKQSEIYGEILRILEVDLGSPFVTTTALTTATQDIRIIKTFKEFLDDLEPLHFTNFYLTTIETGSAILTLALAKNLIDCDKAFEAIFLEELYKADIYDEDKYGTAPDLELKQSTIKRTLNAAQIIFQSLSA